MSEQPGAEAGPLPVDLADVAALRAWTEDDPSVLACACEEGRSPLAKGVRHGGAWAAAVREPTRTHGTTLLCVASSTSEGTELLARLVTDPAVRTWAARRGVRSVTLPREAAPRVLAALGVSIGDSVEWERMATRRAPAPRADEPDVVTLLEPDGPEIEAFLAVHNPRTDGRPFAWPGQTWVGVRDEAGGLLAVGCRTSTAAGLPLLSGIAVATDARGRGLGRAVTAELTRRAVADAGLCTLEMYSDNTVARRLYRGLGYGETVEHTSARLPPP